MDESRKHARIGASGCPLVAAVARLHAAKLELADNAPGLIREDKFPRMNICSFPGNIPVIYETYFLSSLKRYPLHSSGENPCTG